MPDSSDTNTNPTNVPTPSTGALDNITAPTTDDAMSAEPIIPDIPDTSTDDVIVDPTKLDEADTDTEEPNILSQVATKIVEAHNILIALSSDPSVDEISAAIGLALYLDKIDKHVTAIYSGNTPNALEFLKPEETFEQDTDVLRDFVIALNKEKADHLRYKLDGDYVKIFITPYRSRIGSEDLEFSYGDYNVDLVIALDVANGADLDDALREHGRIMHDAVIVNITTGKPGKLGEIEWCNKDASSVSEMVAELLFGMNIKDGLGKEEATAFLTGIIAATNRFANAVTTPRTMKISSRLMESGANQQLISKNLTADIENEFFNYSKNTNKKGNVDPTKLDIEHNDDEDEEFNEGDGKEITATVAEKDNTLLEDLKAAEASLASAAAEVTEDEKEEPIHIDGENAAALEAPVVPAETAPTSESPEVAPEVSNLEEQTTIAPIGLDTPPSIEPEAAPAGFDTTGGLTEPATEANNDVEVKPEMVIDTPADLSPESLTEGTNKYGQMLEDALAEGGAEPTITAPITSPNVETPVSEAPAPAVANNPVASVVPDAPTNPEINGVPEINYMPLPGDEVLPPPPAPPVNFDTTPPASPVATQSAAELAMPETPTPTPAVDQPTPLGPQPAMQDQVYQPQVANPDAFKIPGM